MPKKPTKTRKPKVSSILEQTTVNVPSVEPTTLKEDLINEDTISIQSIKSINLDTDDKIYYDAEGKEYKETIWDKFCYKIYELEPTWFFRLRENIWGAYRDFTSSFSNWRKGYGWIPNSDIWDVYSTISSSL